MVVPNSTDSNTDQFSTGSNPDHVTILSSSSKTTKRSSKEVSMTSTPSNSDSSKILQKTIKIVSAAAEVKKSIMRNSSEYVDRDGGDENSSTGSASQTKKVSFRYSRQSFNTIDTERIRSYMREYKMGAERFLNDRFNKDGRVDVEEIYPYTGWTEAEDDSMNETVWIAGHEFASLTADAFRRPFMFMPDTLGAKQRRILHEMALSLGLYHGSCGEKNYSKTISRRMVIAVHPSGLLFAPGITRPPSIPIRNCKPWFYQSSSSDKTSSPLSPNSSITPVKNNLTDDAQASFQPSRTVVDATDAALSDIRRLVSDPSRCLRPSIDKLDFNTLLSLNLTSITPPSLNDLEGPGSICDFFLINTPEELATCAKELHDTNPRELGFDLEMANVSKYCCTTCLVQLATSEKCYVIDVLAPGVWAQMRAHLGCFFSNPNIVKIGHCIGGMDVSSLHRDFGIFVVNAFDTWEAAKTLKLKQHGLASLCEHYGLKDDGTYAKLKSVYQRSDWKKRPLEKENVRYARYDVRYLVLLRQLLMRDLCRTQLLGDDSETLRLALEQSLGRASENESISSAEDDDEGYFTPTELDHSGQSSARMLVAKAKKKKIFGTDDLQHHENLLKVLKSSQKCCTQIWTHKREIPTRCDAFRNIQRREGPRWLSCQTSVFEELFKWRQKVAIAEETLPGLICSTELLVSIAYKCPVTLQELKRVSFFLPELMEEANYLGQMLTLIKRILKLEGDSKRLKKLDELEMTEAALSDNTAKRENHVQTSVASKEIANVQPRDLRFGMPFFFRVGAGIAIGGVIAMLFTRRRGTWR